MMESSFTPGPWRTQKLEGDQERVIHITSGNDNFKDRIGSVFGHRFTSNGRQVLDERDEANARLIAAAPEMLDALEAFERGFRDFARENPNVNHGAFSQALAQAAQAIAKAKGGACRVSDE